MSLCSSENCPNNAIAKGLCKKHYAWLRYQSHRVGRNIEMHGLFAAHKGLHKVWSGMKQRCNNPNHTFYKYYGGRGIKICDRWINSFKNFFEDMGERPFLGAQLDRINSDGNYEPSNCRWIDKKQNLRNRRSVKLNPEKVRIIKRLCEEKFTHKEIAEIFSVNTQVVSNVSANHGWDLEKKGEENANHIIDRAGSSVHILLDSVLST